MFHYIVKSTSNLKHSCKRYNQATITLLLRFETHFNAEFVTLPANTTQLIHISYTLSLKQVIQFDQEIIDCGKTFVLECTCIKLLSPIILINTRVGTLIVATIYLQLIQNRYIFRSFTALQCSHQYCVQPVASDVEVVGYL